MRVILVTAICLFHLVGISLAASQIETRDFDAFRSIISSRGFVCRTCEGGHFLGEQERGKIFRVYCNDNTLVYKVTQTPNGGYIVSPWNE